MNIQLREIFSLLRFRRGALQAIRDRQKLEGLLAQAAQLSPTNPSRALTEQLLQLLDPTDFASSNPDAAQAVFMQSLKPTAEQYSEFVSRCCALIQDERAIPASWITENDTSVYISVDRFLISPDGYYVDQQSAVVKLREQGLRLLGALAAADNESVGTPAHNLRLLTKVLANLRAVTVALHQVCEKK
jgi:hypothetical protein